MMTEIESSSQLIDYWLYMHFENDEGLFLLLSIIAFVYLFVRCSELRGKLLLPIGVMMAIVLNPILYKYIFSKLVYWRLFWMFPGALLIATMVIILIKNLSKDWIKWSLLAVAIVFIMTQGQNVFEYAKFEPRSNWEKVSQETIDVCDIILAIDDTPRVVVNGNINTEIRQYAPQMILLYGRDVEGEYIRYPRWPAHTVRESYLQTPIDYMNVFGQAFYYGYDFVVTEVVEPVNEEVLAIYDYKEVGRTFSYVIYNNPEVYNRIE